MKDEKEKYDKEEEERAKKLAEDLISLEDRDLEKIGWIMQGVKIARSDFR